VRLDPPRERGEDRSPVADERDVAEVEDRGGAEAHGS